MQLTPPGSPASIIFGTGVTDAAPGALDSLVLVVEDIEAARADLVERGRPRRQRLAAEDVLGVARR